ncbi:DUF3299 domain-containing protein [Thaumasiovibrio subtropicus]|uniref:DUF3299 domain-containing protein n=1 Tax=Thaumasiovibrio subtropicus TaxID=1891207 RepID=UPI000B356819|nr:DUF3299 domain-containing protein [Thaumasiovibrio subtropicus]
MKRLLLALFCWLPLMAAADDVLTLNWLDLIPEAEREAFAANAGRAAIGAHDESSDLRAQQSLIGSVREELNGSKVKIPGFVIPLEGDNKVVTEFLLVPYFGACIHVPPPPPNQIVYVKFPEGVPIQQLWDVIYVNGTLKTEAVNHDLAQVGYMIEGIAIEDYVYE